jgi:hypothetical protein
MALSPNYNWSEPDNSSLVKDGALAMRTLGDAIDTSVWNVGFGQAGKNKIINGAAQFWQRGTTAAATLNYLCDRFQFNRTGGVAGSTVSRSTDVPTGFQYSIKNQRDSGNTSTASLDGYYSIETANSLPLAGQAVTLSFYGKKGADYSGGNFSLELRNGTGTDQAYYAYTGSNQIAISTTIALTTGWARYSITGTVPANSTEIAFKTSWTPSGTAGADDSVYLTGFQLEVGSKATPFQTATGTIQGELAACQRYYYQIGGIAGLSGGTAGNGHYYNSTNAYITTTFPVTMRTAPSCSSVNITNWQTLSGGSARAVTAFGASSNSPYSATSAFTTAASTTGFGAWLDQTNANAAITFSAEL